MSLQTGQKLGAYEIITQAGAGGMGEVYKARDTRLERTVAIKVLPESMATSADLRERLAREAKAISSLSHPNICTLFDIGHEDGRDFLVMEFLEGQTLAERLLKDALPTGEMMKIAIQIADALDTAHRQGLVHRDLKPGNVMLTREGAKLLDFGLAKLTVPEDDPRHLSGLTMTTPLTMDGSMIGTMQYMSPEQLEGIEADPRSDIFAFGALLYEMATGTRPFQGTSQASLIASILKEEPAPVSQVQPLISPMLDQAISQCLQKDPENRWQTAGDLKRALMWVVDGGSMAGVPAPVSRRRRLRERVQWAVIAVLFVGLAGGGGLYWRANRTPTPVVRTTISLMPGTTLTNVGGGAVEISPDGTKLAYVARDSSNGDPRIWVRSLDTLVAQPLPGTDGASFPFWSPESKYIGFFADKKLKKILASGGPALTLCPADNGRGGSWGSTGVILFTPRPNGPLFRVSAAGGEPMAATALDSTAGDYTHRWVHFMPNGRDFLFFNRKGSDSGGEKDEICTGTLDETSYRHLVYAKSNPGYSNGHLLFVRDDVLMAQPLAAKGVKVTGDAVPVAEQIAYQKAWSHGIFTTSDRGYLVYRRGSINTGSLLRVYGQDGVLLETIGEQDSQYDFVVSHDQTRLAVAMTDQSSAETDIWIRDLRRNVRSRLTFAEGLDITPFWSPDDSLVAYVSRNEEEPGLYVKAADGSGTRRLVWQSPGNILLTDWSPDGRLILCTLTTPSGLDIWVVPVDAEQEPYPYRQTSFGEWEAAFSPDGRWVAFSSDESGAEEVYVAPFPGPGGKWQVSNHEGDRGHWSADGRHLFYLDNSDRLHKVEVEPRGQAISIGRNTTLFGVNGQRPGNVYRLLDGGERLLVNEGLVVTDTATIVLVQEWGRALGR